MLTANDPAGVSLGRRRLAAVAIDASGALAAVAIGAVVATVWLLLSTGFGRADVGGGDAVAAVSLVGATLPAWAAWLAMKVRRDGCTPGQRRVRLFVESGAAAATTTWRRQLRLAAHPLALPVWGWLTLTAMLSGLPWLWLPVTAGGTAVALAALLSFALLLARPELSAIHDLLALTRLEVRR